MRPGKRASPFQPLRMWWLAVAACAAGCAPGAGAARAVLSVEEWTEEGFDGRRITTEHFEIISTLRDAEFEDALPGFLETAYQRYEATLPAPDEADGLLTSYVFGTRTEWARFTQRHFADRYDLYSRIRSGGFSEAGTSVSFYVNRGAMLATLAHEGWHQYVGSRFDTPIPAWLDEGFACCHEAVEFSGLTPEFTPRHNTFRINSLREAIRSGRLMTLRQVIETDAGRIIGQVRRDVALTYYAQAWALVTFLRHGAGGCHAKAFDRMLGDISNGTFAIRVSAAKLGVPEGSEITLGEAAFRTYFGCEPEALAGEYYDHLLRVAGF